MAPVLPPTLLHALQDVGSVAYASTTGSMNHQPKRRAPSFTDVQKSGPQTAEEEKFALDCISKAYANGHTTDDTLYAAAAHIYCQKGFTSFLENSSKPFPSAPITD